MKRQEIWTEQLAGHRPTGAPDSDHFLPPEKLELTWRFQTSLLLQLQMWGSQRVLFRDNVKHSACRPLQATFPAVSLRLWIGSELCVSDLHSLRCWKEDGVSLIFFGRNYSIYIYIHCFLLLYVLACIPSRFESDCDTSLERNSKVPAAQRMAPPDQPNPSPAKRPTRSTKLCWVANHPN